MSQGMTGESGKSKETDSPLEAPEGDSGKTLCQNFSHPTDAAKSIAALCC